MMLRLLSVTLPVMLIGASLAGLAHADVKAVGRYKDWLVYTEQVGKDTICFASTPADDKAPKNVEHGDVNFYIATWKSGAASNQPSLKVGYQMRSDLSPQAIVGRDKFPMFASGVEAFVADNRESALIAAIKKGTELRIEAVSAKDARTAYHFSLKGSTDAIDKARSLCR